MRLFGFPHPLHEPLVEPLVSSETLARLADAGAAVAEANAQAAERQSWVERLRRARQENSLGERLRRAFDTDSQGD